MAKYPLITAHTGCMNTVPNTLPSFMEGILTGADYIEVDVRETRDQVVVLMHDDHIESANYGKLQVSQLTFKELMGHNGDIVRVESILELARSANRMVNLDLKNDGVVEPLVNAIRSMKMEDYIILSGCGKEKAAYIKENYRGFQVLLNADEDWLLSENADYDLFILNTCRDAINASCCGINIYHEACTEKLVDYAAARCLPVYAYTVDDVISMEKCINMGVYSITTNRVDLLKEVIKAR